MLPKSRSSAASLTHEEFKTHGMHVQQAQTCTAQSHDLLNHVLVLAGFDIGFLPHILRICGELPSPDPPLPAA